MRPERLGIYGGTFSPPHLGHYRAAEAFLSFVPLDRLLVIPTFLPPHKTISYADSPERRLEMCRLCFSGLPNTEISDLEIRRMGKSYTFDTLTALSKPDRELYFLCGTDMILSFDKWFRYRDLFRMATFVYARREKDYTLNAEIAQKIAFYRAECGADIREIPLTPLELSSTEVRKAVKEGAGYETLNQMLLPPVADYILQNRLYRDN